MLRMMLIAGKKSITKKWMKTEILSAKVIQELYVMEKLT